MASFRDFSDVVFLSHFFSFPFSLSCWSGKGFATKQANYLTANNVLMLHIFFLHNSLKFLLRNLHDRTIANS